MTNTPQSNDRESSPGYPLGFDEFVAILVAFLTLGVTLFWTLSRSYNGGWDLNWLGVSSSLPKSTNLPKTNTEPSIAQPQLHKEKSRTNFPVLVPPFSSSGEQQQEKIVKSQTSPALLPSPIGPQRPTDYMAGDGAAAGIGGIPSISNITPSDNSPEPQAQKSPLFPSVGSKETVKTPIVETPKDKDPFSTVTPVVEKPAIPTRKAFADVQEKSWEAPFLNALSSRGIIEGYKDNSFKPTQPVTRAEYAALLNQAFQDKTPRKLEFSDIKKDYWANEAIKQAVATGFLNGYPSQDQSGRIFIPERKIPRVEVLVALVTGLNLKPPANVEEVLSIYPDNQQIPKYARPKIAAATVNKLVVNHPNPKVLEPNKDATRSEVAAMIHQALVKANKIEPVKSESIVPYQ